MTYLKGTEDSRILEEREICNLYKFYIINIKILLYTANTSYRQRMIRYVRNLGRTC